MTDSETISLVHDPDPSGLARCPLCLGTVHLDYGTFGD